MMKKFISITVVLIMIFSLLSVNLSLAASYETVENFVKNLYVAGLGREPEADGYKYWVDELKSGRPAAEVIGHILLESSEFEEKYKDISDEEFVKKAYEIVFNRTADEEGLKFWVNTMKRGASQKYIITAMLYAPTGEFQEFCEKVGLNLGNLKVDEDEYPIDIPTDDLVLWMDANDEGSVVVEEDSRKVDKWISKFGEYEALPDVNEEKDSRPEYIEVDGKNMIRFNGAQYLVIEGIVREIGDITIFAVSRRTQEQASDIKWQRILSCLDSTNSDVKEDNIAPNFCIVAANPDKDPGNGDSYDLNIFYDNRSGVKLSTLGIGVNLQYRSHQFLMGDIGEILIYDRVLTDDEVNKVKEYLSSKWGISN